MRRTLIAVAVGLLLVAAPASAHGDLVRAYPQPDSALRQVPNHLRLTFGEPPSKASSVVVADGCGTDVVGQAALDDKTIHLFLAAAEPGRWSVRWRTVSKLDGHEESGTYALTVRGDPDCGTNPDDDPPTPVADESPTIAAPDEPTAPDGGSAAPIVLIAVGGIALAGIALLVRRAAR